MAAWSEAQAREVLQSHKDALESYLHAARQRGVQDRDRLSPDSRAGSE